MVMDNKAYKRALGYAFRLNGELYRDIVHDSYITWFNKTGDNLFDQHPQVITQVIKRTWQTKYVQPSRFMYKGVFYSKKQIRMDDIFSFDPITKDVVVNSDIYNSTRVTPEDEYIATELETHVSEFSATLKLDVFLYAVQGYDQKTVAKMTGLSTALVNYYYKRMRWHASLFN